MQDPMAKGQQLPDSVFKIMGTHACISHAWADTATAGSSEAWQSLKEAILNVPGDSAHKGMRTYNKIISQLCMQQNLDEKKKHARV